MVSHPSPALLSPPHVCYLPSFTLLCLHALAVSGACLCPGTSWRTQAHGSGRDWPRAAHCTKWQATTLVFGMSTQTRSDSRGKMVRANCIHNVCMSSTQSSTSQSSLSFHSVWWAVGCLQMTARVRGNTWALWISKALESNVYLNPMLMQ